MVIMALDHTRDYFSGATFDPTDLTKTDALWFFTRWITHFCAPVFVFLAGTGTYLALSKSGADHHGVSGFLLKRGLWLIFLEIAVISPFGWAFRLDFSFTRLQVIWVIGLSMVILAGLIRALPSRVIGWLGFALIALHNVFDGAHAEWLGPLAGAWKALHTLSFFQPMPGKVLASLYPLVPWVGVMAAGFGAGEVFTAGPRHRRNILVWAGAAMLATFFVLRGLNLYGDPKPWTPQSSPMLTVLSLLNTTKYPPSLLYLCMTLGPAALFLAWADRMPDHFSKALATFGRVPLFYYLLHLPLIHGLAVAFSYIRYGSAAWLFQDPFVAARSPHPPPPGHGYGLGVVWLVWLGVVIVLYPACQWFAEVKRQSQTPLLRYL
jgi:uncharacterized membrane protein